MPTRLLLSLPASVAAAVAQQRARPRSVSLAVPHSVSSTLQTSGVGYWVLGVGCWGVFPEGSRSRCQRLVLVCEQTRVLW